MVQYSFKSQFNPKSHIGEAMGILKTLPVT